MVLGFGCISFRNTRTGVLGSKNSWRTLISPEERYLNFRGCNVSDDLLQLSASTTHNLFFIVHEA
jgi:hypothetical protein